MYNSHYFLHFQNQVILNSFSESNILFIVIILNFLLYSLFVHFLFLIIDIYQLFIVILNHPYSQVPSLNKKILFDELYIYYGYHFKLYFLLLVMFIRLTLLSKIYFNYIWMLFM